MNFIQGQVLFMGIQIGTSSVGIFQGNANSGLGLKRPPRLGLSNLQKNTRGNSQFASSFLNQAQTISNSPVQNAQNNVAFSLNSLFGQGRKAIFNGSNMFQTIINPPSSGTIVIA